MVDEKGHPLPASDEARHDRIPERVERDKGRGDDPPALVQPGNEAVEPDGTPYPYRKPDQGIDGDPDDEVRHVDRGQGIAEREANR